MQLVVERCTVRPWRLDDAESVARHANNRKIWLGVRDLFPHPYTIQDAHEFLQRAISEQPEMKFCIEMDGTAVGGIGVHPGRTCIGIQRQWVTDWASSSGDAAS
jgi:RimJ/RimL family protein N-acetyltransferase